MTPKEEAYKLLAKDRFAKCPDHISKRVWAGVKTVMHKRYMREYMNTPEGLYSDNEIWKQTFKHILGNESK